MTFDFSDENLEGQQLVVQTQQMQTMMKTVEDESMETLLYSN